MSNFDALTVRVPVSDKTPDATHLKDADAETLVLFANLLDIALPGQTSEQSNATGQGQETVSDNLSPTAKFMSGPASEQVSSGLDETAGDPRLSGDEIMAFLTDAPQDGGDRLTRLLIVANQMLGSAELNARLDQARLDQASLDQASLDPVSLDEASIDLARIDAQTSDDLQLELAVSGPGGAVLSDDVMDALAGKPIAAMVTTDTDLSTISSQSAADVIAQALLLMQQKAGQPSTINNRSPQATARHATTAILTPPAAGFVGPMPAVQMAAFSPDAMGPFPMAVQLPSHPQFIGPMPLVGVGEAMMSGDGDRAEMFVKTDQVVLGKQELMSVEGQAKRIMEKDARQSFQTPALQGGVRISPQGTADGAGIMPAARLASELASASSGASAGSGSSASPGATTHLAGSQFGGGGQSGYNGGQSSSHGSAGHGSTGQGFAGQGTLDAGSGDASNRVISHRLNMSQSGWPDSMVRRLEADLRSGVQTIRIILEPRQLGRLNVELGLRDGRAAIRVAAETTEAARKLGQARGQLTSMFEQAGLRLASFQTAPGMSSGDLTSQMGSGEHGSASQGGDGKSGSGERAFSNTVDTLSLEEPDVNGAPRNGETAVLSILA